jgi:hypothetical protein
MAAAVVGVAALLAAVLWLVLLVTTNFSPVTLGAGLLAMLYVMGPPAQRRR